MSSYRRCSRTACSAPAIATLTYEYAASRALVGPLAADTEPHHYDLCGEHAERLTVPRGWQVVRGPLALPERSTTLRPRSDDLDALAEAVREAARGTDVNPVLGRGRGHLRVLRTPTP